MKNNVFIFLSLFVLLGGFLRFYYISKIPPHLNIDEVSIGYNAYSILKTGRDEYGNFLPLSFRSVDDYKPPVLIYLTVPSIAVFGLSELAVRFPNALMSTLSIIVYYFLFLRLLKNQKTALVATFLLTISPWNIYFSRYGAEALIALVFFSSGLLMLLKVFDKGKNSAALLSAILFTISVYAYHAERLFVPVFLLLILIVKRRLVIKRKMQMLIFILILVLATIPLYLSMIFGQGALRAKQTFLNNDIEFTRTINVPPLYENYSNPLLSNIGNKYILLFFYWVRKYLNYFQPSFFFYNGLNLTVQGSLGVGMSYLFELPFLIYGFYLLAKRKMNSRSIIIIWFLMGFLPASLTQNEQHALRSLITLPAVIAISATGGYGLYSLVKENLSKTKQVIIYMLFFGIAFRSIMHTGISYIVYFPYQKEEDFMGGTKESVMYALGKEKSYDQMVFDPRRGINGPNIVNIPHMYLLFYSKYNPKAYQEINKESGNNYYKFDKFVIRHINWSADSNMKNTLFVASPWNLPLDQIDSKQVLKKIYLKEGNLVLVIVSSEDNDN